MRHSRLQVQWRDAIAIVSVRGTDGRLYLKRRAVIYSYSAYAAGASIPQNEPFVAVPRSNQGAGRYHHLLLFTSYPSPKLQHLSRRSTLLLASATEDRMSYYDQYGSRNERGNTYPPQQYQDQADNAYYTYENNQPHQSYDQAGYAYQDTTYAGAYRDEPAQNGVNVSKERETNAFDSDTDASTRRAAEPKYALIPSFYALSDLLNLCFLSTEPLER